MDTQTGKDTDNIQFGATSDTKEELKSKKIELIEEEYQVESLPMEILLRGDEAICEQFTVDAETAMAKLGIKRSRLTQISGKELRVARMRIGRYIRPIYRPKDIENYLDWSRSPVSHKKSTELIEAASKDLQNQAELVGKSISKNIEASIVNLNDKVSSYELKLKDFSAHMEDQTDILSNNISQNNSEQLQALSGEFEGFRSSLVELQASTLELNALKEKIQELRESVIDLRNSSLSRASDEANQINSIKSQLGNLQSSHDELKLTLLKTRLHTEQLISQFFDTQNKPKSNIRRSSLLRKVRLNGAASN